jgi:hypothetical protein
MNLTSTADIFRAVKDPMVRALETVINEEIDRVVNEAKARVEANIRGQVGSIAARVLEKFSFEKIGSELVIRVEFPGAKS